MYFRQQGYPSPHLISYKISGPQTNCKGSCASLSSGTMLPQSNPIGVYVGFVQHSTQFEQCVVLLLSIPLRTFLPMLLKKNGMSGKVKQHA